MQFSVSIQTISPSSATKFVRALSSFALMLVLVPLSSFAQTADPVNTSLSTQVGLKKRKFSGLRMNMSLGGESFGNEKEQAQTAGFSLGFDARYSLLSTLEIKAKAGVSLQSGYAQSRFGDNTPKSGVDLREAIVQFKPLSRLTFQAGAIDQSHLSAPLLVSSRPFPGILEKVLIGVREFNLELKAQQTIPTSTTLATRTVEAETTPAFTTETLTLKSEPIESLRLMVYGTHFAYRNLPSTTAFESDIHGNTILDTGPQSSRFAYGFDGWLAGGGARIQVLNRVAFDLDAQMIQNTSAPETYKNGELLSAGLTIGLPGQVDLSPKVQYFFAESDVAPAFYNSSDLGHNNRMGWAADLEATFKQQAFKIGSRYVQADLINSSLLQSRQQYFMIRFETLYDSLL